MLKYKLESLDGIDEETQKLYKQEGNVYTLAVEGIESGGDVAGLKAKVDELLTEKKAADKKAADAEAARLQAEEDAKTEKARKTGDIETIEKGYQEKMQTLEAQLAEMQTKTADKELDRTALEVAAGLAEGANQKILSRFIKDRLRYEGDEIKVTDGSGNLTIATIEQLKEEFKTSEEYASLVIGSKGNGGGATNQPGNGGGAEKTINRSDFDAMGQSDRSAFFAEGGKVVDD